MKKFIVKTKDDEDFEMVFSENASITELLEGFSKFLKKCGYKFHGYCDLLDYDDWK